MLSICRRDVALGRLSGRLDRHGLKTAKSTFLKASMNKQPTHLPCIQQKAVPFPKTAEAHLAATYPLPTATLMLRAKERTSVVPSNQRTHKPTGKVSTATRVAFTLRFGPARRSACSSSPADRFHKMFSASLRIQALGVHRRLPSQAGATFRLSSRTTKSYLTLLSAVIGPETISPKVLANLRQQLVRSMLPTTPRPLRKRTGLSMD